MFCFVSRNQHLFFADLEGFQPVQSFSKDLKKIKGEKSRKWECRGPLGPPVEMNQQFFQFGQSRG